MQPFLCTDIENFPADCHFAVEHLPANSDFLFAIDICLPSKGMQGIVAGIGGFLEKKRFGSVRKIEIGCQRFQICSFILKGLRQFCAFVDAVLASYGCQ